MSKREFKVVCIISCILVGAAIAVFCFLNARDKSDFTVFSEVIDTDNRVSWNDFMREAEAGEVTVLYYMTNKEWMVYTSEELKGSLSEYDRSKLKVTAYPDNEDFRQGMLSMGVNLYLVKDGNAVYHYLLAAAPSMLLMVVCLTVYKKQFSLVGSQKDFTVVKESTVSFDDIIGIEEVIDDLNIVVEFIKDSAYGKEVGAKLPKGILLSGNPGVGKTMIAKAIANKAGVSFIPTSGSEFVGMIVGNGARRVKELFKLARQKAPCIIFIDEFDALGSRDKLDNSSSSSETSQTINALLKEMDGFKELDRVFVLGATNYPERIDEAVKRSGRFDREIKILPPVKWETRAELFNKYLTDVKTDRNLDIESLARTVAGFTGADIAALCNEAAIISLQRGHNCVTQSCFDEAIDRLTLKGSRTAKLKNKRDLEVVAYHEAGHACISYLLGVKVTRISVIPVSSGVGGSVFNDEGDSQHRTKADLENRVKILYAGTVSEELKFNERTTGASNDIEEATKVLSAYCGSYGFDEELGLLDYKQLDTKDINQRIAVVSYRLYDECRELLKPNMGIVSELACKLLDVQVMTSSEVGEFFNEHLRKG